MIENPPAFPEVGMTFTKIEGANETSAGKTVVSGMTLRDYFAGQSLQGMLAHGETQNRDSVYLASKSYAIADAMLAERAKSGK